jgi:hemoglobin
MQPEEKPSLYNRLGGVYSIATVVDDFIDRIMVDPRLNANPQVDEAHHRVPPAGFKYGDGLLGDRRTAKIHWQVDV